VPMLQCTPPMGHVVTFHFHSFRINQETRHTLLIKQNHIIVLDMWEINVGKINRPALNPK